ncbi:hypothetical protein BDY21DRAFT_220035 [Lineolata rhizophorae]|uniref:Apple domain-containing protein n=1 Tax=Lineolata rhizophorae TaxID=578093 RepID=A0A6A6P392_9PEZI|nr:hypothetical protein BDY21DRAFT_220035 [Lineolata rhizophorae]
MSFPAPSFSPPPKLSGQNWAELQPDGTAQVVSSSGNIEVVSGPGPKTNESFAPTHLYPAPSRSASLFGWGKKATFAFLGVLVAIIVGLIGALIAVAVSMSSDSSDYSSCPGQASTTNSASSATTSFSTTTVAVTAVPTQGFATLDCPNVNDTSYETPTAFSFTKRCGVDYRYQGGPADIVALTAYSFDACIDACGSYNHNNGAGSCFGVAYNPDLTSSLPRDYGNCWLKPTNDGTFFSVENPIAVATLD